MISTVELLARKGNKAARLVADAYNPDQPRDEKGMWAGSGAAGNHRQAAEVHEGSVDESEHRGSFSRQKQISAHTAAAQAHRAAFKAHTDRVASLTKEEHGIVSAMSAGKSDKAVLAERGVSLEQGHALLNSARQKLGIPEGGQIRGALKERTSEAESRAFNTFMQSRPKGEQAKQRERTVIEKRSRGSKAPKAPARVLEKDGDSLMKAGSPTAARAAYKKAAAAHAAEGNHEAVSAIQGKIGRTYK